MKNAGWIFVEKIVRTIITFILFALISRQLGPTETGILNFSQSIVLMLLCITSLGLDSILINDFSKNSSNDDDKILYSTVMLAKFIVSFVVLFISILLINLMDMSFKDKMVFYLSLLGLIFQTQTTFFLIIKQNQNHQLLHSIV